MSERNLVRDARKFTIAWRIWFWILLSVNFIAPLLFIQHTEAVLVLLSYIMAGIIIVQLHRRLGWVRLLGVGHILWVVLLPWLIYHYARVHPVGVFGMWFVFLIIIDILCLGIDLVDVVRYLFGDRDPIV